MIVGIADPPPGSQLHQSRADGKKRGNIEMYQVLQSSSKSECKTVKN